jgi:hypothetical protein
MPKFIEVTIGNNWTQIRNGHEHIDVHSTDVIRELFGFPVEHSNILPPVVRCFNPSMSAFLVERTPFVASIWYKNAGTHDHGEFVNYKIPIPWTVYLVILDAENNPIELGAWARPSQMYVEEDELYHLPMPNVYDGGGTCFGTAKLDSGRDKMTIGDGITAAIQGFWSSQFNNDLSWYPYIAEWIGADPSKYDWGDVALAMEAWSQLGIQDVMNAPMRKETTVGTVIQHRLSTNPAKLSPAGAVMKLEMLFQRWLSGGK